MTRACRTWTTRRRNPVTCRPAAGAATAELVGLHGDVDAGRATLQAAWPFLLAQSQTSSAQA